MPNGLARVFSAQDEKPHMGVSQGIFHEAFDAEVFRLECADNRSAIRRMVFEACGERGAMQCAHRDRRLRAQYMRVAGKRWPALACRWCFRWAEVELAADLRACLSKGMGGNGRVADRTPQAIIMLRLKHGAGFIEKWREILLASRGQCGHRLVKTSAPVACWCGDGCGQLCTDDLER
jgi:hypothetical protein